MTVEISAIPPLVARVRALAGELYLCREVADALGVSPATLRRLGDLDPDRLGPSHETYYGRVHVLLYDQAAVDRLHGHLAQHRSSRGRPRLWDDQERRMRRAGHSSVGYRRRRSVALHGQGDHREADAVAHRAEALSESLRSRHARRTADLRIPRPASGGGCAAEGVML